MVERVRRTIQRFPAGGYRYIWSIIRHLQGYIVNKKKIDHLHLNLVGNPSAPIPAMIAGLPGVEALATAQMRKEMERLEIPPIREFIEMLDDAGADLYGCQMALDMFKLTKDDLVPQVKEVLTAMDFMDMSEGAQIVFV